MNTVLTMKDAEKYIKRIISEIRLTNFLLLIVAGIVNAVGIIMFLYPVNIYDSGISGLSMLLAQLTPNYLSLSLFLIVLNMPIFIFGFRRQGPVFTVYSVIAVISYAVFSYLIINVLPVEVDFASPLAKQDLFLCAVFGGIISGIGSGLTIRFGGAIDGIEVLAVIFAKRLSLSVGSFVMMFNVVLYVFAGIVLNSWILPLYSIVTYMSALKTVDFIVEGLDKSKSAFIISEKADEICQALSEEFGNGITLLNAKGFYSSADKNIVYFVVNRFQIAKMKSIIEKIDKNAFVSISEISEVMRRSKKDK